jgi:hypothetical protein
MKHLRRFDEKLSGDDIKDMANNYLSYLVDKDYIIEVSNVGSNNYDIDMVANHRTTTDMYWEDIKDDVIPFVGLLGNGNLGVVFNKVVMYNTDEGNLIFSSIEELTNNTSVSRVGCLSIEVKALDIN